MRKVGIVGLGLIGGSLGMALRRSGGEVHVTGVSRSETDARLAQARGAADIAGTRVETLRECDLVVVATPISQFATVIEGLGRMLPGEVLITDVASVKEPVLELARGLPDPGRFLGGHPMAGKAESGLRNSDATLFEGTPWVLTPSAGQDISRFGWWLELITRIGARPVLMSAEEHDRQAALVSHLAFTLSAAYASTVREHGAEIMAGPGFRGMTRLAAGDPRLYGDIAAANRQPLLEAIDDFSRTLAHYRRRIEGREQLTELFAEGSRAGG